MCRRKINNHVIDRQACHAPFDGRVTLDRRSLICQLCSDAGDRQCSVLMRDGEVAYLAWGRTMSRNERHVVKNDDGGWDVRKPGSDKASAKLPTQADAIDRAREIVGNSGGGEVVIHGRDGKIRDSDTVSPGNDPNPPKDRK